MPQKKKRVEIPPDIEAQVQFLSDRTCCVCRVKGKPIQIHHIDDNPANNEPKNLAVLCLECHNETQIRGGFGRKLNAEQVILYRDDWLEKVAKTRPAHVDRLEKKVAQEFPAEYEKQIQQQMMGVVDFRQAIDACDWKQAEKVLRKYPNLPEGRSLLGLSMSSEVQEYFSYQLPPVASPHLFSTLGGPITPMYYIQSAQTHPRPAPPRLEAIHWLEKALQHDDDPDGKVTASLALMYGYNEDYDRMIDTIKKAGTINSSLIAYFQYPVNLMMLIYACRDLASINQVMRNVNLKLPKIDEVQQAITKASDPRNNPYVHAKPYIEWYAVEFRMGNGPGMPVKVLIAFPGKNGLTYAQISKQGQFTITIPPQASIVIDTEKLIPIDEILKQLTDKGIVLITPI